MRKRKIIKLLKERREYFIKRMEKEEYEANQWAILGRIEEINSTLRFLEEHP